MFAPRSSSSSSSSTNKSGKGNRLVAVGAATTTTGTGGGRSTTSSSSSPTSYYHLMRNFIALLRTLGYKRLVSLENFRYPNFRLMVEILCFLLKRYDHKCWSTLMGSLLIDLNPGGGGGSGGNNIGDIDNDHYDDNDDDRKTPLIPPIDTEKQRIKFVQQATHIMVTGIHLENVNIKKLYMADHNAVQEMAKLAQLIYDTWQTVANSAVVKTISFTSGGTSAGSSSRIQINWNRLNNKRKQSLGDGGGGDDHDDDEEVDNNNNSKAINDDEDAANNMATIDRFDIRSQYNNFHISQLSSDIIQLGTQLYDMLATEMQNRAARLSVIGKQINIDQVESIIRQSIASMQQEMIEHQQRKDVLEQDVADLNGKLEKKYAELNRNRKRLQTLHAQRPIFMDELEKLESEIVQYYDTLVGNSRCLSFLEQKLEEFEELEKHKLEEHNEEIRQMLEQMRVDEFTKENIDDNGTNGENNGTSGGGGTDGRLTKNILRSKIGGSDGDDDDDDDDNDDGMNDDDNVDADDEVDIPSDDGDGSDISDAMVRLGGNGGGGSKHKAKLVGAMVHNSNRLMAGPIRERSLLVNTVTVGKSKLNQQTKQTTMSTITNAATNNNNISSTNRSANRSSKTARIYTYGSLVGGDDDDEDDDDDDIDDIDDDDDDDDDIDIDDDEDDVDIDISNIDEGKTKKKTTTITTTKIGDGGGDNRLRKPNINTNKKIMMINNNTNNDTDNDDDDDIDSDGLNSIPMTNFMESNRDKMKNSSLSSNAAIRPSGPPPPPPASQSQQQGSSSLFTTNATISNGGIAITNKTKTNNNDDDGSDDNF